MNNIFNIILPIGTLIIGGLLGFYFNILLEKYKYQKAIISKIIDRYFLIRDEICDELCDLANLKIQRLIDFNHIDNKIQKLSKLFYKYYDFLPKEVLQEINCLYACLQDEEHNIYVCKENSLCIIKKEEELNAYIKRVSLISNVEYFGIHSLNHSNAEIRNSVAINFQTRMLLRIIHEYFTLQNLSKWVVISDKNGKQNK